MTVLYKSLRRIEGKLYSWFDTDNEWVIGEWKKINGEIRLCMNGFHGCKTYDEVKNFTEHGVIVRVEVRGDFDILPNQEAWSEMRVLEILS